MARSKKRTSRKKKISFKKGKKYSPKKVMRRYAKTILSKPRFKKYTKCTSKGKSPAKCLTRMLTPRFTLAATGPNTYVKVPKRGYIMKLSPSGATARVVKIPRAPLQVVVEPQQSQNLVATQLADEKGSRYLSVFRAPRNLTAEGVAARATEVNRRLSTPRGRKRQRTEPNPLGSGPIQVGNV